MPRASTRSLLAFAVLLPTASAQAAATTRAPEAGFRIAQVGDGGGSGASAPDGGTSAAPSGNASPGPSLSPPSGQSGARSATGPSGGPTTLASPAPTGATRNNAGALPTTLPPSSGSSGSLDSSITYGGPQQNTSPVYGSTLRDNGAGNGGVPTYSSAPGTLGGPINGTANAYYATLPAGAAPPGQATTNGQGTQVRNGDVSSTQQPLGGAPYTRDQTGTFGGRAGYNAQGIYNGTAAQTGTGYGSGYATSGRPIGGLLSTGVDATGPLRPYVPMNTGTIGHPNSGYGVPNGSRSTHMDGRGVQRLD